MRIAEVALDRAGEGTYHYEIPPGVEVAIGARVRVPFRRTTRTGTVVSLPEGSEVSGIRPIAAVLPGEPLSAEALAMAAFVADRAMAPLGQALTLVGPPAPVASRGETWALKADVAAAIRHAEEISRRAPKQAAVLRSLAAGARRPHELEAGEGVLRSLERDGWIERRRRAAPPAAGDAPPQLTPDQDAARRHLMGPGETVLFGVTGSGKTEVYLAAIADRLEAGEGAIVLAPEIALTPQLIERFERRFGDTVATLHSRLPEGERASEVRRIREGRARVVIGARSAVFAPMEDLGLVVLDEAHEASFQQEDQIRYHARDVARFRLGRGAGRLVEGSATPDVVRFYEAIRGRADLVELGSRFGPDLPEVRLVDLRKFGRQAVSGPLLSALREAVADGGQAILFLNRRGYHPVLLCRECGQSVSCPHCAVSLVHHQPEGVMRCHQCGFETMPPNVCPACTGRRLLPLGLGTQRLEAMVKEALPQARVLRLDQDVARRQGAYEDIYEAFRDHRADILVGTQMVAKGFDFPDVSLVGVVLADQSLRFPDYRSGERTFQLVAQAAGRSGRRERGLVVVQAFDPDHYALQSAARHDYRAFFEREIEQRREANYPPFTELLLFGFSGTDEGRVMAAAAEVGKIVSSDPEIQVLGPAPAMVAKVRDRYRFQVLAKHPVRERLRSAARGVVNRKTPAGVRLSLIFDPMHLV